MKFAPRAAASPARNLIAETNSARAAVNATSDALIASMNRLAEAQAAPAAIEAELARLDATAAADMAAWSRSGDGPMPVSDSARRDELERDLRNARSAAAAASTAYAGMSGERERELGKLAGIETHAKAATARVVLETAMPLFEQYEETARALARLAKSLEIARILALTTIESIGDLSVSRDAYQALSDFDRRLDTVRSGAPVDHVAADKARTAWKGFMADLREDSAVTVALEVTP
jgi:hypothetical protein